VVVLHAGDDATQFDLYLAKLPTTTSPSKQMIDVP